MTHNPAKFRFPTLKNQGAKARGQNVTVFDGTSTYRNVLFSFVETLFVACFVTASWISGKQAYVRASTHVDKLLTRYRLHIPPSLSRALRSCLGPKSPKSMCELIKQALKDRSTNAKCSTKALPNRPEALAVGTAKLPPSDPLERRGGEVEDTTNGISERENKPTVCLRGRATGGALAEPAVHDKKTSPTIRRVVADEARLPAVLHARSRQKPHRQNCFTTSGRRPECNGIVEICVPSSSYLGEALGCLPFAPGGV